MGAAAEAASHAYDPGRAPDDLSLDEVGAVYERLKDALHAGYQTGDKRWIPADYVRNCRSWKAAFRFPANSGFHSGRRLFTSVNEAGLEAYIAYAEDPEIPAGTLIAKESFTISDDGTARPGPLFFMKKVSAGTSPETDDWHYIMAGADGRPQAVGVITACSQCHQENFGHQGGLGYPVEEA